MLRSLPSVEKVLSDPRVKKLSVGYQRNWITGLVRECIDESRTSIQSGYEGLSLAGIIASVEKRIRCLDKVHPKQVINATGVIIHTNIGRAPMSDDALAAIREVSQGYSNLELDLQYGSRGSRQSHLQAILNRITGAEAAIVVNNNASAVLLGLSALAKGREVIVSRGESVEIGGGFRIPEVLAQSGAILVEVGTTNRTYTTDYEKAITENTAAILMVHGSNFRISGFTHSPKITELVELGKKHGIQVLHDIGSGCLLDTREYGLAYEPRPQDSIKNGVGLVFFSGDKLLGGPQAGIIVGREELVGRLARHPLARAVRIDKMSLAALTVTLLHYLKDDIAEKIPVWQMIATPTEELKKRASFWKESLGNRASICPAYSTIGGGSLPGETLDTWVIALSCDGLEGGAQELARGLRGQEPAIIARIENDQVMLDPRTVLPWENEQFIAAVKEALS